MINNRIRHAADEQRCYQVALKTFAQPLLSPQDATALVQFAKDQGTGTGGECRYGNDIDWPFKPAETSAANLIAIQNKLGILSTSTGYSAWAATSTSPNQMAFAAMSTQTSNLLAEVTGYITGATSTNTNIGQSNSDYKTLVDTNRVWRQRLSKIAGYDTSHSEDPGKAALTAVLVFHPARNGTGAAARTASDSNTPTSL